MTISILTHAPILRVSQLEYVIRTHCIVIPCLNIYLKIRVTTFKWYCKYAELLGVAL